MSARTRRHRLAFYATPPHPCSYLPGRRATTVFADPAFAMDGGVYTALSRHGFRRSGAHVYRPQCAACSACVPVRVPVAEFHPRRSQRRVERANRDLCVQGEPLTFRREHFELYRRYLAARHPQGGMDDPSPRDYLDFLQSPWGETRAYAFQCGARLLAVAVADVLSDGLSAVYTFFDPGFARRSPGVHAVLWQIREAQRLGLDWLYLGYWIAESPKMRYKRDYQPQEHYVDGRWVRDTGAADADQVTMMPDATCSEKTG